VIIFKITRSFGDVPFEEFLKDRMIQIARERYGIEIEVTRLTLNREAIGDIHDPKTWEK